MSHVSCLMSNVLMFSHCQVGVGHIGAARPREESSVEHMVGRLYRTVLYCTVLYYTVLYCTILYYTVL